MQKKLMDLRGGEAFRLPNDGTVWVMVSCLCFARSEMVLANDDELLELSSRIGRIQQSRLSPYRLAAGTKENQGMLKAFPSDTLVEVVKDE